MDEEGISVEKIGKAIISYLQFTRDYEVIKGDIIVDNENFGSTFIFREFLEGYIIDRETFSKFDKAVNFDALSKIEPSIEDYEKKIMEELKKYLKEHPNLPKFNNIKIYSELEELKSVVTNFESYAIVNKNIICDVMNIPSKNLENKQLKITKNENNTCYLSNNYTLVLQNKKKEESEFKNLYYVEDLTKKIFILLYFNEKMIQYKLNKKKESIHDFKRYCLIRKEWIDSYKEFFSYDFVIDKFKEVYNNYKDELSEENLDSEENNFITSYKATIFNINEIIKDMGQISLFSNTTVDNYLRNAKNLFPPRNKVGITILNKSDHDKEQETPESDDLYPINIPIEFYLIDGKIVDLLEKEEFFINFDYKIKNNIESQVLIGNGHIIIRNFNRNISAFHNEEIVKHVLQNEYLIYADKNCEKKYLTEQIIEDNNPFILCYILYYNTNKSFFNDLRILSKENGLKDYITKYNIDLNLIKKEINLMDDRRNYIGFFINIRINKDYIKIVENENNEQNEKEYLVNIINNIKDYKNKNIYNSYDIIDEINLNYIHYKSLNQNNNISISNDINNNIKENKNGNNITINKENKEKIADFLFNYFKKHTIDKDIQSLFEDINDYNYIRENNYPYYSNNLDYKDYLF